MFTRKGILKICSKFTGEHPCRIVISRQLLCNFMEIVLLHGCSPVNLLHILRTPFIKNTCARLLLNMVNVLEALHISLRKSATECSMLAEVNYVRSELRYLPDGEVNLITKALNINCLLSLF